MIYFVGFYTEVWAVLVAETNLHAKNTHCLDYLVAHPCLVDHERLNSLHHAWIQSQIKDISDDVLWV